MMHDEQLCKLLKDFILTDQQMQEVHKRFCEEIHKGLAKFTHDSSDIKCFVTYVQDLPTEEEVGKYLALDLGGTNFRVLLVTLKGHHDADIKSKTYAVPKEIMVGTGAQLFDHIAECLSNFVNENKVRDIHLPLGFTFSFPCVQLGLRKAILVRWTKGFQCSDVEQEDVGRLLREAIKRKGNLNIDVMAIINDTTGTLMSCAHRNSACRIGVIIGTGCNACYVEDVKNVELLENEYKNKKHVIVNCEWGAFGERGALDFVRTDYDQQIDKTSLNPGKQLFEKMISGMYLGELIRRVLLKAITENIIFSSSSNRSKLLDILSNKPDCFETRFISDIEADTGPEFTNTIKILEEQFQIQNCVIEDCEKLQFICETIAKRSANLVGIGLSGLVNKMDISDVVIGVDGTVYRLHPKYENYLRKTMLKLVTSEKKFDIMLSEDGSGIGAALVAAVANRQ